MRDASQMLEWLLDLHDLCWSQSYIDKYKASHFKIIWLHPGGQPYPMPPRRIGLVLLTHIVLLGLVLASICLVPFFLTLPEFAGPDFPFPTLSNPAPLLTPCPAHHVVATDPSDRSDLARRDNATSPRHSLSLANKRALVSTNNDAAQPCPFSVPPPFKKIDIRQDTHDFNSVVVVFYSIDRLSMRFNIWIRLECSVVIVNWRQIDEIVAYMVLRRH
jgi:hypothetical protein